MIIHNPKISGSLQFPSDENGNLISLQVQNGTLETITLNSSGVDQNIQPAVNYSGSFTGSFVGDGSNLSGVAASDFNIDILSALGGASIEQSDNFLISDAGTEKKVTFSNLEDSIFANVSGDISIAAGGAVSISDGFKNDSLNSYTASNDTTNTGQNSRLDQLSTETGSITTEQAVQDQRLSAIENDSGSYLKTVDISSDTNLAVSDTSEVNMILSGDTLSAELIGGVISGSAQVSIDASQISDVDAFSQSGTYANLRAQATTAGDVGLGNVTNESKATMFTSAALTGTPTSTTPSSNDDSTKIATTAYVQTELTDLVGNAPAAFDTLGEISASLAADSGALDSLTTVVSGKLQKNQNLSDLSNVSTARTNLGLVIGTDVQAYNSTLATVAGGTYAGDNSIVTIGTVTTGNVEAILPSGVVSGSAQVQALGGVNDNTITFTAGAGLDGGGAITLNQSSDETITFTVSDAVVSGSSQITLSSTTGYVANEHIDHSSVSITAGTGLNGGGTIASTRTLNVDSDYKNDSLNTFTSSLSSTDISDVDAFSQSGNYSGLRAQATTAGDVGLGNVDNTSDANKPVSTAGQTALDLKANLASPALTGNPTAPTQADNDNSTKIATTAYVQREVSDLLGGAPAAFDTLLEISASIANGDSDVVALTTTVGGKLQKDQNLSDLTNASTARSNLGVDAAGTDNSTDVTLSGTPNYITISGQTITRNTIDISDDTNLAVADTSQVDMILSGDTLSANLKGGVISGSAQLLNVATDFGSGRVSGESIGDVAGTTTFTGSFVGDGTSLSGVTSYTDSDNTDHLNSLGVISGSSQISGITNSQLAGSIANNKLSNSSVSFGGVSVALGSSDSTPAFDLSDATNYATSNLSGTITNAQLAGSIANDKLSNSSITINGSAISLGGSVTTPNDNTQLSTEQVQDIVGGMLGGTETGITVTYQDGTGDIDFVVASQTDNNFTTTLKNKLDGIAESANNYVLPTNLAGDDIDIDTTALTGATVISDLDINITTDTSGRVTDANGSVATRTLTKGDIGLGNVTNESKSTMFTSPTFTGTTAAPTPSADDNSTKIATTAYVQGELTGLIGGAPAAFDTLLEISASIANGDSDVVALTTVVGGKLQKDQNLSDLTNASTARSNLGVDAAGTINYVHPTFNGDDFSVDTGALTGATVVSDIDINVTTDSNGHVTDANGSVATRTLTAANLGLGSGDDVTFGTVRVDDATASTTKTTGALIVDGGVGISGALNVGGDVVAYASSDERLKDNIELISNPIEKVQSLKGVTWNWNENADELQQSLPNVGVIAQDVEKVLPQLVTDRDNGFKGVDYAKLTGLLIEAVKDQQKQIDELKSKLS